MPWSWKDVKYIVPEFEEQFQWMFDTKLIEETNKLINKIKNKSKVP